MKKILLAMAIILAMGVTPCYSADQWDKTKFADDTLIPNAPGLMRVNNEAIDRLMQFHKIGADVAYNSASQVTVSLGSVACSNSGDTIRRLRTNTSSTTVTWANIDTGAEAGSTTYYVYAVADTDAETFTIEISTSSSAPTGATYFLKLGSFFNDGSSNIDRKKIYTNAYGHAVNDSSGIPKITAIYSYGTSYSSFTTKGSDLKIAYGFARDIAGSSTQAVTNLPFESASTYSATCASFGSQSGAAYPSVSSIDSGSQFTIKNNHSDATNNNGDCNWIAIGY